MPGVRVSLLPPFARSKTVAHNVGGSAYVRHEPLTRPSELERGVRSGYRGVFGMRTPRIAGDPEALYRNARTLHASCFPLPNRAGHLS